MLSLCRSALLLPVAFLTLAPPVLSDEPVQRRGQAQFEVSFMKNMIDHHNMAVMMAMLCKERAYHEDLLDLCEEIIATQSAEMHDMQSWLHDWYGISYRPQMTKQMQRDLATLTSLRGKRFEIAFMEMMIEHHMTAIKEGRQCLKKANHEELIELCENIIATQSMEITLMESWLCNWYHRCD